MTTITILIAGILVLNIARLCLAIRQQTRLTKLEARTQDQWQKMQAGFLAWVDEVNTGVLDAADSGKD